MATAATQPRESASQRGLTLKATFNILEDFLAERLSARESTLAVLNILDDMEGDRWQGRRSQAAMLNILEDFDAEKTSSKDINNAMLNILEDLEQEKLITTTLNAELEQRVAQRTAELAESEERFRLLIEGVKDYAIFMLDPAGLVVTWNMGAERMKGYRAEEIIGSHFSCFYPDSDIAAGKPQAELALALQEGSFEDEGIRQRKDGSLFVANVVLTPVFDPRGRHVGYAKITRDISERQRAEQRFRATVESAPTAMLMIDRGGTILMVNSRTESLFGYLRSELLGQKVEMLVPNGLAARHSGLREGYFQKPEARRMGTGRQLYARRKDGSTFPAEIGLNPIETDEGLFVLGSIADITERLAAQAQQLEAVRREVLLKEIHHRVKNNLQVISSLLFLQSTHISDGRMKEILRESQNRVKSIALIHEKLYRSPDLAKLDFGGYVRDLVADLYRTYLVSHEAIGLVTRVGEIFLEIDTAIPCGLVINELISNALKHAFPNGRQGSVVVELMEVKPGEFLLSVRDDGVGLPADFDWRTSGSFGLRLVNDLTKQLDGSIELLRGQGTEFRISFKEDSYKEKRL